MDSESRLIKKWLLEGRNYFSKVVALGRDEGGLLALFPSVNHSCLTYGAVVSKTKLVGERGFDCSVVFVRTLLSRC